MNEIDTVAYGVEIAERVGLADRIRANEQFAESELLVAAFGMRQAECEQYKGLVERLTAERNDLQAELTAWTNNRTKALEIYREATGTMDNPMLTDMVRNLARRNEELSGRLLASEQRILSQQDRIAELEDYVLNVLSL